MAEKKNIIIVGAGFGGITAVLQLEKKIKRFPSYRLLLIDQNSYQLYAPALYEIAAIPREIHSAVEIKSFITIPVGDVIRGKSIEFVQEKVVRLELAQQKIFLSSGQDFPYEFLVLATGSEINYFDIPGLREHSYPLKRFEDAVRIRNKIEGLLEKNRPLTIIVGGAGSAGVEVISEFSNFVCVLQKRILHNHPLCNVRLLLIEAAPEILPGFDPWVVQNVRKRLIKLGVAVQTGTPIVRVTEKEIVLKDTSAICYDFFIWSGGVIGATILQEFSLPLTEKRNLRVNEFLEATHAVYAVGDAAGMENPYTGKSLPWNIPIAESEARMVARNIIRKISGRPQISYRPRKKYPFVITVGKKYAIADLLVFKTWGLLGWCVKLVVELRYLLFILPPAKAISLWWQGVQLYRSND